MSAAWVPRSGPVLGPRAHGRAPRCSRSRVALACIRAAAASTTCPRVSATARPSRTAATSPSTTPARMGASHRGGSRDASRSCEPRGTVDKTRALANAHAWVEAFNRHDLEAILSHYAESVALTSLLATRVLGDPALRAYFAKAWRPLRA